jgi:hypothetical protein
MGIKNNDEHQEVIMLYIAERRVPPPEYILPVLALAGLVTPFH